MVASEEETKIQESGQDRWQSRPVMSAMLRGAVFAVPIVLSATVSVFAARRLVNATGTEGVALRFLVSFGISIAVLRLTDRVGRRLLPLAVLWKLSLAFPTAAPNRWKVARQAANIKQLEAIAAEAREKGIVSEPARAAEHILALVAAVEAHDRGTRGHSERVRIYADLVAEEIGLDEDERNKLRWASLLHDVGKLMVPATVLNKPSKLDDAEFDLVKEHPNQGMRFIEPLREWLGEWALAVEQHHERYDGGGYPHGRSGWEIARAARIVAVADSYEVMTARRPYKRPMKAAAARAELVKCAGSQFDPAMVRAFLQISIGRLRWVAGPLAWVAQAPFLRGIEQMASGAGAATTGGALVLGLVPTLPVVGADAADSSRPPAHERVAEGAILARPEGEPLVPPLPDDDFELEPDPALPSPTPTESVTVQPSPFPTPEPKPTPYPTTSDRPSPGPGPTTTGKPPTPTPTTSKIATPTTTPTPTVDPTQDPKPTESPRPETSESPAPQPTSIGRLTLPAFPL